MENPESHYRRLMEAVARTEVVKSPRQHLQTFGTTKLKYYIVTEPSYRELIPGSSESVIREGNVTAGRPMVVTPTYMTRLEGFGDEAQSYFQSLARQYGPHAPGILYHYKNEPGEMNIVEGTVVAVADRISSRLVRDSSNLSAVIKGVDELWDVSLLKFIFEYTLASVAGNVEDFQSRKLLDPEPELDVPRAAVQRIETLFRQVEQGEDPSVLKRELDVWGLFDHYQDRFFALFRKKSH